MFCFCELANLSTCLPTFEPIQCLADLPAGFVEQYWEAKQLYMRMQTLLRDPTPPKRAEDEMPTADEELIDAMVDRVIELQFFDWFYANFIPYLQSQPFAAAFPASPSLSTVSFTTTSSDSSSSAGPGTPSSVFSTDLELQITQEELDQLTSSMREFGVPLEPFKEFDDVCRRFNNATESLHSLLPFEKIVVALPPPCPEAEPLDLSFLDSI